MSTMSVSLGIKDSDLEYKKFNWSGYDWVSIENETNYAPGHNDWSWHQAWVDNSTGELHLNLSSKIDGKWYCAEIWNTKKLGRGIYQFWIDTRLDKLDKNVVFGLFNYPSDTKKDGTHEIDVEFAHWDDTSNNIWYTIWENVTDYSNMSSRYPMAFLYNSTENNTTQRFIWRSYNVTFQSLNGHKGWNDNDNKTENYTTPDNRSMYVANKSMPIYINLWLRDDNHSNPMPPTDGKPVEIVIKKFEFISEDNSTRPNSGL